MTKTQLENLLLQVSGGDAESYEIIMDEFSDLTARLELLNGTAATKLEKHNTEMEQYKKQVIELRNEGKSWAMISEITGINVSTVRSWVRNSK